MRNYSDEYVPPDLRRDDMDPPRQSNTSRDVPVPLTKVGTARYPDDHLEKYGITRDEAGFMKAVVEAMNRELDGYRLTESMTKIKGLYDIDEDKLQAKGYLKRHTGVARRCYYTVTPSGQEACHRSQKHGFMTGDAGDDTPHRVGVELARQYYKGEARRVEISPGSWVDLVAANNHSGERIATVEVEGGRISADPSTPAGASPGINDYASIRHDYQLLADAEGESVWVVRNHEIIGTVLRALSAGDTIDVNIYRETIRGIERGRVKIGAVNDKLDTLDARGIDRILTFQQLRNRL